MLEGNMDWLTKTPLPREERGLLFQTRRSQRILMPIRIKRHDKNIVKHQVFDIAIFIIE
jgi:hypothetical protein